MPTRTSRTLFVGREAELRQLEADFDAAVIGHGALALVVGEPGIGKTALCEQFAARVTERGGRVLVGHCYEPGSFSIPYLPFIEALRAYVLTCEPHVLAKELGAGAAEVARLMPDLRQRLPDVPEPPAAVGPETARYRLLQAVTDFLRAIATARTLLLVLEDLHDADRGTLDLLIWLFRHLTEAHLLVVGTYREMEVDRAGPLAGLLAELLRAAPVERVRLGGLAPDEAGQVLRAITRADMPRAVVEAVRQQTEGHPLFLREVARDLAEQGLTGGPPQVLGIPAGLREVIGTRLSHLSPTCNRVLSIAAVIGRGFSLETLTAVAGEAEEIIIEALDAAVGAGVLEEWEQTGTARYQFVHALFCQTLYEELRAPQRIRLHQQVARALEQQYTARTAEHAAELAEHFSHSSSPEHLAKAVAYGELAAQRASAVAAYAEAARLLDQCLRVQEVVDPDDTEKRCDLLLALGDALLPAGENERVADEVAPAAFALAEGNNDRARAGHACRLALDGLFRGRGLQLVTASPSSRQWAARTEALALPGTVDRVYVDLARSGAHYGRQEWREAMDLGRRATRLARELDDLRPFLTVGAWLVRAQLPPRYWPDQAQLVAEIVRWPRMRSGAPLFAPLLLLCSVTVLTAGERDQVEALWQEATALAAHGEDVFHRLLPLIVQMRTEMLGGQLMGMLETAERLVSLADELGAPRYAWAQTPVPCIWALWLLGRPEEALAFLPYMGLPVLREATTAECLARAGRRVEATELLARLVAEHGLASEETEPLWSVLVILLRTALALGERDTVGLAAERLAGPMDAAFDPWTNTAIARLLGNAAAMRGDQAAARTYYEQALAVATKVRCRTEIALTRLNLAELLMDGVSDERTEAATLLDSCIPEFEAMQMQPALTQALALRDRLGPSRLGLAAAAAVRSTYSDGLTPREVEVLGLLATGLSNPEIAETLVVSVRTVGRHIDNIYGKIGIHERRGARQYARDRGLIGSGPTSGA